MARGVLTPSSTNTHPMTLYNTNRETKCSNCNGHHDTLTCPFLWSENNE